ncbi:MAG: hypothetical protein D6751_06910 [Deltaproteobacteria bacterium]|nr:MAG: hypothetical protein D6751_06910 [Deltaproteobacteria bacterium]
MKSLRFHYFAPLLEVHFEPSLFRARRVVFDFETIFAEVRNCGAGKLLVFIAGRDLAISSMAFYALGTQWAELAGNPYLPTALVFRETGNVDLELLQMIFDNRQLPVYVSRSETAARLWLERR